MGMMYQRGKVWWIKYYRNGRYYRESTGTTKKMVAQKLLERREGEIAQGKMPGILFEKVTFDELAEDFLRDYRINQKKSLERAERSVNHLKDFFWRIQSHSDRHQPDQRVCRNSAEREGGQCDDQPGAFRSETHAQPRRSANAAHC